MKWKDRKEVMTKEGCSRVNIYKLTNIIHSYTLECGYHLSSVIQKLAEPSNLNQKIK